MASSHKHWALVVTVYHVLILMTFSSLAFPLHDPNSLQSKRSVVGFDIPIQRAKSPKLRRRGGATGEIGLGDDTDTLYTIPIQLGSTLTTVDLDTGSSDLWVASSACTDSSCGEVTAPVYDLTSFNSSGTSVTVNYGDSTTRTSASGPVGFDTVTLAGIAIENQPFAAVNSSNNNLLQHDAAGIFGLSFPTQSDIQTKVVKAQGSLTPDTFVNDMYAYGPLLSRISLSNQLENDVFAIYLQRNEIEDNGPGNGTLTIGKLPDGVDNSSLTWVPVRLYSPSEGGITPPNFASNEVYPSRWEIDIDGVYLDGKLLPISSVPAADGIDSSRVSALIDTGNSLIRGPSDVVNNILTTVSSSYSSATPNSLPTLPCTSAHTLAFQIGEKMFPVDPRDFIGSSTSKDTKTCVASSVKATDPPSIGTLFRWSLGDPFLKSTLVAFHYGNLTHPSVDPPRIGFLSMVPSNADSLLTQAVDSAQSAGGFETITELAPTACAAALAQTATTIAPAPPSLSASASAPPSGIAVPSACLASNSENRKTSNASRNLREKIVSWSMCTSIISGMGVILATMAMT